MNAGTHAAGPTRGTVLGERTVSVVIPTYNNVRLLRECLDSLQGLEFPQEALSVIVVDNASTDGTSDTIRIRFPEVRLVQKSLNSGFAAACNAGARESDADYVAFLNDDAVADPYWLTGLFAALHAGGEGAVCAASHIRSRDGSEAEYSGGSSNLFGAARPVSVWGWPDLPQPPAEGSRLLFASGGAMLVHRQTFLQAGGFDEAFFAYFEDVDLGWRLNLLGHDVVYAPDSVVRHIGGATGTRSPIYRRYTLWECNSLATILKNFETGNMERVLSAALLLEYRRALMAAGDAYDRRAYHLGAPVEENQANVERLPKVSLAHLAAIDRFNSLVPRFMAERQRIQAARKRPDSEVMPLLGHAWQPQFAGSEYAGRARALYASLGLYGVTGSALPNRVLVLVTPAEEGDAEALSKALKGEFLVAQVTAGAIAHRQSTRDGVVRHTVLAGDPALKELLGNADAVLVLPGARSLDLLDETTAPIAYLGGHAEAGRMGLEPHDMEAIKAFCRAPGVVQPRA